jgi:L-lactate permease
LTDILASLAAIVSLVVLLKLWKPKDNFIMEGDMKPHVLKTHSTADTMLAWMPYLLLVILVLLWSRDEVKVILNNLTYNFGWPGLHNLIQRVPPVAAKVSPYAAMYKLDLLAASGTACMIAAFLSALLLKMPMGQLAGTIATTFRQLKFSILTIAVVLGLAFLMNYSGSTATLGLAFAATGVLFPFFSALLGWLGVFLTGSDTSANALFGNLQVVTATTLNLNPLLMAASNSAGGVMGKMISLSSIAVAAAATGMSQADESRLFRFTLRHSIFLASVLGVIVVFYAYVAPDWVR